MGKVIRFPGSGGNDSGKKEEKGHNQETEIKSIYSTLSFEDRVRKGVEDYILYNFAVKNVLGMDVVYKKNEKNEVGVLGAIAYEHKRRAGTYVADFAGKGYIDKEGNVHIDLLAFKAGEPEVYNSLMKIMKAKKILPQIKEL
ncbi:hypothetical protein [Persephonella sp.]